MLSIRPYGERDWPLVWGILEPVFRSGETYAFSTGISPVEAHKAWVETPACVFVAEQEAELVGTYYLKPNQPGQGGHVCNCGYVVGNLWRGQGIAGRMCAHSLEEARRQGFKAMQYNLVVSTNEDAIHLWQKMGFKIEARLPRAFNHPRLGYVDALVLYQWLQD
jgi:RimJ/RimL family protein N-acetyltransferase